MNLSDALLFLTRGKGLVRRALSEDSTINAETETHPFLFSLVSPHPNEQCNMLRRYHTHMRLTAYTVSSHLLSLLLNAPSLILVSSITESLEISVRIVSGP